MADLLGVIQLHVAGLTPEQDAEKTVTLLKLAANEIVKLSTALQEISEYPANDHQADAAIPLTGMVVTAKAALGTLE